MECLSKQLEDQKSTLERVEMQNVNLTQRLHETLEEMGSVAKERDELRSAEERLTIERDQLKESLKETVTRVSCHLYAVMQLNVVQLTLGLKWAKYKIGPESLVVTVYTLHIGTILQRYL